MLPSAGVPADLESLPPLPEPVPELLRLVHRTKLSLIRTRQQLDSSYKEVCAEPIDKCRSVKRPASTVSDRCSVRSLGFGACDLVWTRLAKYFGSCPVDKLVDVRLSVLGRLQFCL